MHQLQMRGANTPNEENIQYLEVKDLPRDLQRRPLKDQLCGILQEKEARNELPDLVFIVLEKVGVLRVRCACVLGSSSTNNAHPPLLLEGRIHTKKSGDTPHAQAHGLCDFKVAPAFFFFSIVCVFCQTRTDLRNGFISPEIGVPVGHIVQDTLVRVKSPQMEDSLAHKIIDKLGGHSRYTLAPGTPHHFAGRAMIQSLPETALLVGVHFTLKDGYSDSMPSCVGVMATTAAHDQFWCVVLAD